jgi:hypothetical protein
VLRGHAVRLLVLAHLFNSSTGEVTGTGFGISIGLMALFTAINFLDPVVARISDVQVAAGVDRDAIGSFKNARVAGSPSPDEEGIVQ